MRNGSCINQNYSQRQTRDKQKIAGEVQSPVSVYDFRMIPFIMFFKQLELYHFVNINFVLLLSADLSVAKLFFFPLYCTT